MDSLAQQQACTMPGCSAQNAWRMRQFFEAYRGDPKLSALLRVLPWSYTFGQVPSAKCQVQSIELRRQSGHLPRLKSASCTSLRSRRRASRRSWR